ncbi:MAG: hypothetical protein OHK0026_07400 [Rhodocyclaceae bacterium]
MLHPGLRLLLWAGAILVLQVAAPGFVLAASCACLGAALLWSRAGLLALLSRSRWLLVALAVFFSWGTPGLYVWPDLGGASPTREGLAQAAVHLARLAAIIALVSLLIRRIGAREIVTGLRALLAPFGSVRDRLAVRLMLVLREVEDGEAGWRALLEPAAAPPCGYVLRLAHTRLGRADLAAAAAAAAAGAAFWLL